MKEINAGGAHEPKDLSKERHQLRKEGLSGGELFPGDGGGETTRKIGFGKDSTSSPGDKPEKKQELQASGKDKSEKLKTETTSETQNEVPKWKMPPADLRRKYVAETEEEKMLGLKGYRKKIFFLKKYMQEDAFPIEEKDQALLENITLLSKNRREIEERPVAQEIKEYLASPSFDPYKTQKYASMITSELLKDIDTNTLDMPDLAIATDYSLSLLNDSLPKKATEKMNEKFAELQRAVNTELVHSLYPANLRDQDQIQAPELYEEIFGKTKKAEDLVRLSGWHQQRVIKDEFTIGEIIGEGKFKSTGEKFRGEYGRPASPGELEQLNDAAADTLEKLHVLKAYGITPFEVSGEKLKLPWDVVVTPPIGGQQDDPFGKYAEGAVADFTLLPRDQERSDILFRTEKDSSADVTRVSIGDSEMIMRFRLHDNGQISHGSYFHNTPSDITERTFETFGASEAYQRFRGLFIALAFDATVPDEVTSGKEVGGSVASQFPQRPTHEPVGTRITELVLRRRRALQRANVNDKERTPTGWLTPEYAKGDPNVAGYFKKIPEGAQARPTAEAEARKYYADHNLPFPGMPEGKTWVDGYYRRTADIQYRRARFRRDTSTRDFLDSL